MKKSKLDKPGIKQEVIQRLAIGETQASIARDVGLDRSQVCRFARREEIRPFIEREQMKLVEAVPDDSAWDAIRDRIERAAHAA